MYGFKFGQHDAHDKKDTAHCSSYNLDVREQIVDVRVPLAHGRKLLKSSS